MSKWADGLPYSTALSLQFGEIEKCTNHGVSDL